MSKFIKISALAIAGCLFGASLFAADTTMEPSGIGLPSGKPARGLAIPVKGSSAYSWPFVMKSGDIMTTTGTGIIYALRINNTSTVGGGQVSFIRFQNNATGFTATDGSFLGLTASGVATFISNEQGDEVFVRTDGGNINPGVQNIQNTIDGPLVLNIENLSGGTSAFSSVGVSQETTAEQIGIAAFSSAFSDADVAGTTMLDSKNQMQIHSDTGPVYIAVGGGATGELDPANRKAEITSNGFGFVPSTVQVIDAAADAILANASMVSLNPDADYILTSTPTIADGDFVGQLVVIFVDAAEANEVVIQSKGVLANSNLRLGDDFRTLRSNSCMTLIWDGTDWLEVAYEERNTASATTTDATPSAIKTFTTVTSHSYSIRALVTAQRTGGAAGAAGDGASYNIFASFKNIAGTVTQRGTTTKDPKEDQAAWDFDFTVATDVISMVITGAVDNNITWHVTNIEFQPEDY